MLKRALLALLLGLSLPVGGKQMYKYVDAEGVIHYSDKKPDTDRPVESRPLRMPPAEAVSIENTGSPRRPLYIMRNHLAGPVEIRMLVTEMKGVRTVPELPAVVVLGANEKREILRVEPLDATLPGKIRWRYTMVPGAPNPRLDSRAVNRIPFPRGKAFWVSQGFNGKQTHTDAANRYAIDITMPEGTPVLAVRDGVVMQMEDNFFEGGKKNRKFLDKANVIRLLHDDGSMSVYAHLKLDSARVYPGQRVAAGEQLAESGNTGFSSGPHLHFSIQINSGGELRSIAYEFTRPDGQRVRPDRQMRLKH